VGRGRGVKKTCDELKQGKQCRMSEFCLSKKKKKKKKKKKDRDKDSYERKGKGFSRRVAVK